MKNSEFINHVLPVIKSHHGTGTISYLDLEEGGKTQDGYKILSLRPFTKTFNLESYLVSTNIPYETSKDLEFSHGISGESLFMGVLENEAVILKDKKTYERFKELGDRSQTKTLSAWQKFIRGIFKSLKFYIFVGSESKESELPGRITNHIMLLSNMIAARSRRGPADFVICNSKIGSIIQDHPSFIYLESNSSIKSNPGTIYPIGTIADNRIKVFVNPFLSWNDNTLVLGRKTQANETGVYLAEKDHEIIEDTVNLEAKRITLKQRLAWVEAGDASAIYHTSELKFKKKPLWRTILSL